MTLVAIRFHTDHHYQRLRMNPQGFYVASDLQTSLVMTTILVSTARHPDFLMSYRFHFLIIEALEILQAIHS